jgi:hypothetical protein
MRRALATLDDKPGPDEFVWRKLVLRWKLPDNRFPDDEDEDRAEELAEHIEPLLSQSALGEVNGFEFGRGQIDILIFGKATDCDVDELYKLLVGPFRDHGCPPGSSIIRFYNDGKKSLESDVIAEDVP